MQGTIDVWNLAITSLFTNDDLAPGAFTYGSLARAASLPVSTEEAL